MAKREPQTVEEHWKERFGFVSGTVLVWCILFLKIWPFVAMFQTGVHIHAWSGTLPGQTPQPGSQWFYILTLLIALGVSSLLFCLVHLLYRGLWLGFHAYGKQQSSLGTLEDWLQAWAARAYVSVFVVWFFVLLALFLSATFLISAGFELFFRNLLSSTSAWIRLLSLVPVTIVIVPVAFILFRRIRRRFNVSNVTLIKAIKVTILPFIVLWISWVAVLEFCYTVHLSLDKNVISRSKNEYTKVLVDLGGATSDNKKAILQLRNQSGKAIQSLQSVFLGSGHYASYLRAATLQEGAYNVVLTYPRYEFVFSYPFFQRNINRSKMFVVIP